MKSLSDIAQYTDNGAITQLQLYDIVIRTQAEFEALYKSPTWFNAISVAFIGDGGSLKFTKSDGTGVKIPLTVKRIDGFNTATIQVTDFSKTPDSPPSGSLFYSDPPPTPNQPPYDWTSYSISSITVLEVPFKTPPDYFSPAGSFLNCHNLDSCIVNSTSAGRSATSAFCRCVNLDNCTHIGKAGGALGFLSCRHLTRCTSQNTFTAFSQCWHLTSCHHFPAYDTSVDGTHKYTGSFVECSYISDFYLNLDKGSPHYIFTLCTFITDCFICLGSAYPTSAFISCSYISNCYANAANFLAFDDCYHLSNCTGAGNRLFYNCGFLNGCSAWHHCAHDVTGGAMHHVDTATCDLTNPA